MEMVIVDGQGSLQSIINTMAAKMTHVQQELWPDIPPTNPIIVAAKYDKEAANYEEGIMADGWAATFEKVSAELDKRLKPDTKNTVLDLGCGTGMLPNQYDFTRFNTSLYGFDNSARMLEIAKQKNKYVEIVRGNAMEPLPYSDGMFDVIIANGMLGYLENATPMSEFLRILKYGGYLVFSMREMHFQEHGWAKCLQEKTDAKELTLVEMEKFWSFPKNPNYKHIYQCTVIRKGC